MNQTYIAKAETVINAPAEKVWEALTNPDMVKQYLFGTTVKSDWKVGSPITYSGEWEGKKYEDKGRILEVVPNKKLVSTYFSSMSGKEDKPENYNEVCYLLEPAGDGTKITIVQDNNDSQESA